MQSVSSPKENKINHISATPLSGEKTKFSTTSGISGHTLPKLVNCWCVAADRSAAFGSLDAQAGWKWLVSSRRQQAERRVVHDVFADAHKVHDLRDAEQRSDDQRPAAGPLQEGRGSLLTHDFAARERESPSLFTLREAESETRSWGEREIEMPT